MDERKKLAFWAIVVVAFLLVCVPSAVFLDAFNEYRRYLSGLQPGTLRPVKVNLVPHRERREAQPRTPLDFAEFAVRKPKAKTVSLIGDFNGWKEGSLPMTRADGGIWQLALPLPKGRHHYLFLVDGKPELDASNPEKAETAGRTASVRVIR